MTERCWLLLHEGDASVAWKAFHRFAHHEDHPPIAWTREFKVHYYDFLSSADGEKGKRGGGYEADVPHFREFRVGMATQHGYYPWLGDYIHPDRKTWQAMRGDKQGAAEMSFDKMRARLQATRAAGAKAAIYLHPVLFDDATPFFQKMRDSVLVDAAGKLVPFPWQGPDTQGKNWRASLASPQWREHLLQQAQWIMEILQPDAITVDETFAGLGYDYHPNHAGPTSTAAIDFYRKLRALGPLVRQRQGGVHQRLLDVAVHPLGRWRMRRPRLSTACSAIRSTRRSRCATSPRWATSRGGPAHGISSRCGTRR